MSLVDAVNRVGPIPPNEAIRSVKKRYSELLSKYLAEELAAGLRGIGFANTKPDRDGVGEKAFQGGLGSKRVDVSYSDEQHGLLLAVSIKTICFPQFGKNLKNRFADMCTEAITLHMRFPYSIMAGLFAFPVDANQDTSALRKVSTYQRATKLFATISGRKQHVDAPEKFENFTMLSFQPVNENGEAAWIKLLDCKSATELAEDAYLLRLRSQFLERNPHIDFT